jgi:hypothetical protein
VGLVYQRGRKRKLGTGSVIPRGGPWAETDAGPDLLPETIFIFSLLFFFFFFCFLISFISFAFVIQIDSN